VFERLVRTEVISSVDCSIDELLAAWKKVRKGGRAPGPDGVGYLRFAARADTELDMLRRDLNRGVYVPEGYRLIDIPKERGGTRPIQIATFRDRVAQRVLLHRLQPLVEAVSAPTSFAFRPGIGVKQALAAVHAAQTGGFADVLEGDVKDCFESISIDLVTECLAALDLDPEIIDLILQAITAGHDGPTASPDTRGLPQGAVLSPTLCNLVLSHLDRSMLRRHRRLVRYADDFLVLCRSPRACDAAHDEVSEALAEIQLRLNPHKTAVTDFQRGFEYLGARFIGTFVIAPHGPHYGRPRQRPRLRSAPRKLSFIF